MSESGVPEGWPGARLGLPATGRGSVASWFARVTALVLDWAGSMIIVAGIAGPAALRADDWRQFLILIVFFVESSILTGLAGGSFGQLLCRITVARLDGRRVGILRGFVRQALVCLVLPAVVADKDRRGLHDVLVGTAVLNRR